MTGDCLIHGVIEDLGREVVQGGLIRAADIHAGPAPHRLQALKDLDILRRVTPAALDTRQFVHAVFLSLP